MSICFYVYNKVYPVTTVSTLSTWNLILTHSSCRHGEDLSS